MLLLALGLDRPMILFRMQNLASLLCAQFSLFRAWLWTDYMELGTLKYCHTDQFQIILLGACRRKFIILLCKLYTKGREVPPEISLITFLICVVSCRRHGLSSHPRTTSLPNSPFLHKLNPAQSQDILIIAFPWDFYLFTISK